MSIYGEGTIIAINVSSYAKTMYIDTVAVTKVSKSGDTMRLDMAGNNISNVSNPISTQDAVTKCYVDTLGTLKLANAGDDMSGALSMGDNKITDVGNSANTHDVVTKYYIEQLGIPKFVVTSGIIPIITDTDITIYTVRSGKTVSNGIITIAGL